MGPFAPSGATPACLRLRPFRATSILHATAFRVISVTNQWGRGGTTNGRRSGNSSGMALAIVASLLIGAAGSYGYVRYAGHQERRAHQAMQEERDKLAEQVRRQSAELDDLTLKLMAADGDKSKDHQAADAEERKLQDDLARMTQSRDTLQHDNDRLGNEAAGLQAQIDGLTRRLTLAEQGNTDADGARARLTKALADAEQARDAALKQVGDLKASLDEAQASLRGAAEERDRARDTEKDSMQVARKTGLTIKTLTAELDKAKTEAVEQAKAADDARQALVRINGDLDAARQLQQRLQADLARVIAERDALSQQAAREPVGEQPAGEQPAVEQPATPTETATPRPADTVERVLERTPGLAGLSDDRRDDLKRQLVAGACVATALEGAFGRVPLVTLRNMIRDLQSGC